MASGQCLNCSFYPSQLPNITNWFAFFHSISKCSIYSWFLASFKAVSRFGITVPVIFLGIWDFSFKHLVIFVFAFECTNVYVFVSISYGFISMHKAGFIRHYQYMKTKQEISGWEIVDFQGKSWLFSGKIPFAPTVKFPPIYLCLSVSFCFNSFLVILS